MADETKGKGKHVGGRIKEGVGDILGDRKMKREGRAKQVEGEAEQEEARAEEKAERERERKARAKAEQEREI